MVRVIERNDLCRLLKLFWINASSMSTLKTLEPASLDFVPVSFLLTLKIYYSPANIYLIKVSNRSTRKWCEIWSELTRKTQKRDVNDVVNISIVSFADFEHVNGSWEISLQY